jgi:hypothetical protein
LGVTIDTATGVEASIAYLTKDGYVYVDLEEGETYWFNNTNPYIEVEAVGEESQFTFTVVSEVPQVEVSEGTNAGEIILNGESLDLEAEVAALVESTEVVVETAESTETVEE